MDESLFDGLSTVVNEEGNIGVPGLLTSSLQVYTVLMYSCKV